MTHVPETVVQPFENPYDELPYPGSPFSQTHPMRMATIGALFGMTPAAIPCCRVLELGCADGGNLIPMAVSLPASRFVGVDLSGRQIDNGCKMIEALSLDNIRLEHRDIMDVDEEFGTFDYVIAHGVFSWVSYDTQERIFEIVRKHLNPNGIAYISYNTFPGWHMRGMLRDMMLYHTRQFGEIQTRIDQARALINFLADAVPARDTPYGLLISNELASMRSWSDTYIFHESLEVHNEPIYFHQFAERAARHQLRYLGEANFSTMLAGEFSSEVAATLAEIGRDIVEMEQYMDFLRNRMFRQTLICHADTALDRTLTSACCEPMHIRSFVQPVAVPPDLHASGPMEFRSRRNAVVTVKTAIQKAGLLALAEAFPATIQFSELITRARAMLEQNSLGVYDAHALETQVQEMRDAIFKCFCDNLMELNVSSIPLAPSASEHPRASPLARLQAQPDGYVTNLLHEQVQLDVVNAHLLRQLDGEHDRPQLLSLLAELASAGKIIATRNGEIIEEQESVKAALEQQLESRLQDLARLALLLA